MTEFGNIDLIEERETREGGNVKLKLPGVYKGDLAARTFKPEVNVFDVKFSPTGIFVNLFVYIFFIHNKFIHKIRLIVGSSNYRRCLNLFH